MSILSFVLSITCPLVLRHCGTQTEDRQIWMDMNRRLTGQVMGKYWTKWIGNRQWVDNRINRPFTNMD